MSKLTEKEWDARRQCLLEAAEFLRGDAWTDDPVELAQGEVIADRLERMAVREGPRRKRTVLNDERR